MISYLFYPVLADGSALLFVARDLVNDEQACSYASTVLAQHASAHKVQIWRDDRLITCVGADPMNAAESRRERVNASASA